MRLTDPSSWELVDIQKAEDGKHKYRAFYQHVDTGRERSIPFGALGYEHYADVLGCYSDWNHWDKERREHYYQRHAKDVSVPASAGLLSAEILWPLDLAKMRRKYKRFTFC